ncbi:unnamed protein product, partial [Laminaria digitata]
QHQQQQEQVQGALHHQQVFSWSASTLTDCSVCLEAYRAGDGMCRLPCGHAFHAACIDTWLDQQHVCPQCRLDLLPPDLSWGRSSQASAATNPPPFASIFGSLERMILASHHPATATSTSSLNTNNSSSQQA